MQVAHLVDSLNTAIILAQADSATPRGSEFGKASPIGWFILILLVVVILYLGWAFHRRFSRLNRRRVFAEAHGLDLFDEEAVDKAMEEAGILDQRKKHWLS